MKTIKEITDKKRPADDIINDLKKKSVTVPSWEDLEKEYNPKKHPVYMDPFYTDKAKKDGIEKVSRIAFGWQKLATKRMTEMIFGIPVKRTYSHPEGDKFTQAAKLLEALYTNNHIDAVNIERGRMLFASCEIFTLWYAVEKQNVVYGEKSLLKLRNKTFSPMQGDALYPLFDEFDDLIAFSIAYKRKYGEKTTKYFDTYTESEHIRWSNQGEGTQMIEELREDIKILKIPGAYMPRPEPVWEDTSDSVYEAEWNVSRNGNYLRKNMKPIWVVCSDEKPTQTGEGRNDDRVVLHYPSDTKAGYQTWSQATDSLKFHIETIRSEWFRQLQIPDLSADNLKNIASGDSKEMMLEDAKLKVRDESGEWVRFFNREFNVIREFAKVMFPSYSAEFDQIKVENVITPYTISDEKAEIDKLVNACGKPIMSQKTAIAQLGWVDDVDTELNQLQEEAGNDLLTNEPTF